MSSESSYELGLVNYLADVSSHDPEIAYVSVNSQRVAVEICYGPPLSDIPRFRKVRIEIFSEVTFRAESETLNFRPPVEDWGQNIPNRLFSIEGEKVSSVVLKENSLQISMESAVLSASINDPRVPEAIQIFPDDGLGAFII